MAKITIPALPAKTGTISDSAYIHLVESSVNKKMTVAQLLAKNESQYSSDIATFLGSANKAEGRANLFIDRRVTVNNANYTILATDKVVAQIGTMSAARTFSLPAASTVQAGAEIIIIDESGSVTSTNKIIVQRNGTDTIDGATSREIVTSYGFLRLICDGSNSWKIADSYNYSSFSAGLSSNQSVPTGTTTVVTFNSEDWDLNNEFDISTYRFTPKIKGNYLITTTVGLDTLNNGGMYFVYIRKNGLNYIREVGIVGATGIIASSLAGVIEMNGSSDYVDVTVFHNNGSNRNVFFAYTKFSAHLLLKT